MKTETKTEKRIEKKITHEYWAARLVEIRKACRGKKSAPGALSLPPPPGRKWDEAAEAVADALRKRFPRESVYLFCGKNIFDGTDRMGFRIKVEDDVEKRVALGLDVYYTRGLREPVVLTSINFPGGRQHWRSGPYGDSWFDLVNFRLRRCDVETIVEQFGRFRENYARYREELRIAVEKRTRPVQMAKATIRATVPRIMARAGCEWKLAEEEGQAVLRVKMPRSKMLKIVLRYGDGPEKLLELESAVGRMKSVLETMPFQVVDLENLARGVKWEKGAET